MVSCLQASMSYISWQEASTSLCVDRPLPSPHLRRVPSAPDSGTLSKLSNKKCSPNLVIFFFWVLRRDALIMNLQVRESHHHKETTQEHSTNPGPTSLWSGYPFQMLPSFCPIFPAHTEMCKCPQHCAREQLLHQSPLPHLAHLDKWAVYFCSTCWPVASCSWDNTWASWTTSPWVAQSLFHNTPAKGWVKCSGMPNPKSPWYKRGPATYSV